MQIIKKIYSFIISKGILIYLLLGLFIFLHLYLVSKTFFFDDLGNMKVAIAGYGDIPFHMTQISKFAYGSIFDFNEPLFTGERIRYAFLINYISGIFLKLTGSWTFAMHFPSMVVLILGYIFSFLAFKHILGRRWAALLAIVLFMLGSGLGGWEYIRDHWYPDIFHPQPLIDYLVDKNISTVSYWKASYPDQNISWGGALPLVFLHQRSFFMGFFLFSLVIYVLSRFPNLDNKRWRLLAGIAFGLGPLGHYHTFLTLSIVIGFYFLVSLLRKNFTLLRNIMYMTGIAFVVALPQVIYLWGGQNPLATSNQSFMNFRLGWMVEPTIGSVKYPEGEEMGFFTEVLIYIKFLWVNFGFILPTLILSALYKPLRRGYGFPALWFATLLFIFVQTVRTQPWDYDTNKILVYFSFFSSAAIMSLLVQLSEKRRIMGGLATGVAVVLIIFSGVIDILPRSYVTEKRMPVIFDRDAQQMAYFIRQNIEPSDLVITSPTHLNIVSSLAGHPTVVGYPGWLWTKGVDYGGRETELRNFYANPLDNLSTISKYRAGYVLFDPTIVHDWKARREVFDANFQQIQSSKGYILYKLP